MIKAVIFDLDGLLIDTEPLWQKAELKVLSTIVPKMTPEMTTQTIGLRVDQVVDYWYKFFPWNGVTKKEISDQIELEIIKLIKTEGKAKPGVTHITKIVKNLDLSVALASSSYYGVINAALQRLKLTNFTQIVHSAEDEKFGKPHPAVYLTTAKKLGVNPKFCLALEDSLRGVKSAKAAQMKCIAIPDIRFNKPKEFDGVADKVVGSLNDINENIINNL